MNVRLFHHARTRVLAASAVVLTLVIGINTLVAGQAEPGVQAQGIGFAG